MINKQKGNGNVVGL